MAWAKATSNMSRAPFAVWFQFFATAFENCGEKGDIGKITFLTASTFPCKYPSTNAPCSFTYHRRYEILIIHGFLQKHRQKIVSNVSFYEEDQSYTKIVLS
jgi:hypothetical protein